MLSASLNQTFPSLMQQGGRTKYEDVSKMSEKSMLELKKTCLITEGRKEMFYLMMHSTHFIYGYMASDMVKDSKRGNPLPPHGLLFSINSKGSFICTIHRQDSTNHGLVTPVVEHWLEREIAQWVHPMKDRSYDPSHHERTLLPRSYISLLDYGGQTSACSRPWSDCLYPPVQAVTLFFSCPKLYCKQC